MPTLEQSRLMLLEAVGPAPDLTLIRPTGNIGDELIFAGTRRLLDGHVHREIEIDELAEAGGELAVICGGGAWGRSYVSYLPEVLAIAELRFDRVVVFPSTFEVAEDRVRDALARTRATVFARELESYRQIRGLCRAELAHDCAFFADFAPYENQVGEGTLDAFRTDDEGSGLFAAPADNNDISAAAASLDDWLATIARYREINTDRAHVMIAGALMGKRVNYRAGSYFKVDALAQSSLGDYDVHRIAEEPPLQQREATTNGVVRTASRTTIHLITRDGGARVTDAIESLIHQADAAVMVDDRNSQPATRRRLEALRAAHPAIDVTFADRDIGFPASLRLATEQSSRHVAASEYVLFLRDDMRLAADAISRLVASLDYQPEATAATPAIVNHDGVVQHCGGWPTIGSETCSLSRTGRDLPVEDLDSGESATGWVPLLGTLFRRSAFAQFPLDDFDDLWVQNIDWCLRADQAGHDRLIAVPDARIAADWPSEAPTGKGFRERRVAARQLSAYAEFFERSGMLLSDRLLQLVPELRDDHGELDVQAAKLLLTCVSARGSDWTLMEWMNGGLAPLLGHDDAHFPGDLEAHSAAKRRIEHIRWLEQRNEMLTGIENGGWWRLRNRLQPLRNLPGVRRGSRGRS